MRRLVFLVSFILLEQYCRGQAVTVKTTTPDTPEITTTMLFGYVKSEIQFELKHLEIFCYPKKLLPKTSRSNRKFPVCLIIRLFRRFQFSAKQENITLPTLVIDVCKVFSPYWQQYRKTSGCSVHYGEEGVRLWQKHIGGM